MKNEDLAIAIKSKDVCHKESAGSDTFIEIYHLFIMRNSSYKVKTSTAVQRQHLKHISSVPTLSSQMGGASTKDKDSI